MRLSKLYERKINCYWEQRQNQKVIIFETLTIIHPCIDVVAVKDVHDISKIVFNTDQGKQDLQIHAIFLTDSDHDYILEEIECR